MIDKKNQMNKQELYILKSLKKMSNNQYKPGKTNRKV